MTCKILQVSWKSNLVRILHICLEMVLFLQDICTILANHTIKVFENLASKIPILQVSYFMFGKWSFFYKIHANRARILHVISTWVINL